jgi:hypothetical protein
LLVLEEVPIMSLDSSLFFEPLGPRSEKAKERDDEERPFDRGCETARLEQWSCRAPRNLLTALACARALLDALETVIDAGDDEATRDIVIQVAEHLALLASTMTLWKAADR